LDHLSYQGIKITVGKRIESSIIIVLGSQSDFKHVSARIDFSDCCSQLSQI
jgi:hypothetical protein